MGEHTAKAKEVLGWATGDREVEAKGRVEQDVADPDDDTEEVTPSAVADELVEVRHDHGEYEPC